MRDLFITTAQAATTSSQAVGTFDEGTLYVILYLLFVLVVLVIAVLIFLHLMRKRNMLPRSLNTVTFLVTVPKIKSMQKGDGDEEPQKEEKDLISIAEQMFASLSAVYVYNKGLRPLLLGKDHLGFEIVSTKGEIRFYVTTPRRISEYVEKHIHAQYPKAQIDVAGEYNIFKEGYQVAGAVFKLKKKNYFPIKTYKYLETDPLNAITSALSKFGKDEGGAIQILARPAAGKWAKTGNKIAREMMQGKGYDEVTAGGLVKGIRSFGKTMQGVTQTQQERMQQGQQPYDDSRRLTQLEEETVKGIEEKANKLVYEVVIRVLASSQTKERANLLLENIVGAFQQFSSPSMNSFYRAKESLRKLILNFVFRYFNNSKKIILNTEELASLFHLPTKYNETPNILLLTSKKAPPPLNVSKEGILIGNNVYRGVKTEIKIDRKDRLRHMYVIGKTGGGKSTLMENLAVQDIQNGDGVCVVDPHGDLIENILLNIPKERVDDVVIFEPFNLERPVGLNMLECYQEEQKDFVVQEMIAIFYKLFPPEMIGPMFEHNMRNVMLTLMANPEGGTIVEIPRMFSDEDFQKQRVSFVKDPVVRAYWEQEMAKTSDFHKSEMLGYLISKVGRFVENEMMRNIIGQTKSGFNVRDVMDNNQILLVNLSKGKTGEVNSDLLGLIIVSKIQMAAMARADIPEEQRKDFYLYIDEFQNYTTDSIATILSEARKYKLGLTVAHQYIAQLTTGEGGKQDTTIRDAIFGNVGTIISYRVGVDDAETFSREFHPVFDENDVMNIEKYNAYAKLMIDGTASKPFNMEIPMPFSMLGGSREQAEAIKQLSRMKYGRDRVEVEEEISKRAVLGGGIKKADSIGAEPTL
ncbi:type IV secretory system conjugative DNA transfer family protein [Patescibacteria group bacterium]|nr:type IV secretory system conjugative DNA transfer family protein [Patescibacteria group bacterium]